MQRSTPLKTTEDFEEWARVRASGLIKAGLGFRAKEGELTTWSDAELKAALEQGLHDPAIVLYGPELAALCALMQEWSKREPDAAWAWLQKLPSGPTRLYLAGPLMEEWPAERAEEGMRMVFEHRGDFESSRAYVYGRILGSAFESAATRGPQAVDELLGKLRENGMQYPFEGLKLPAGFDFAGWAHSPELSAFLAKRGDRSFFVDAWMSLSPEAALTGVLALNREAGDPLGTGLFEGFHRIRLREPEVMADRAKRIAIASSGLPADEQRQLAEAGAAGLKGDPATLRVFVGALADPAIKEEAGRKAAAGLLGIHPDDALEILEDAIPASGRLAALDSLLKEAKGSPRGWEGDASPDSLRVKLTRWGAEPDEAASLIDRLQNLPR